MKKWFTLASLSLFAMLFSACNKDCICKYYNNSDSVINTEVYDGDDVSHSECADMDGEENVATEIDDNMMMADHVSCSTGW